MGGRGIILGRFLGVDFSLTMNREDTVYLDKDDLVDTLPARMVKMYLLAMPPLLMNNRITAEATMVSEPIPSDTINPCC